MPFLEMHFCPTWAGMLMWRAVQPDMKEDQVVGSRILVAGMPGTGKSSIIAALARSGECDTPLFVGGCASNMGSFLDSFERIVLLTAPTAIVPTGLPLPTVIERVREIAVAGPQT
jgi:DNA polymerase III delta prime subunit